MRFAQVAVISGTLLIAGCTDLFECGNEEIAQHVSPSGDLKVIVFQRNCGATTGHSIQGSILDTNEGLRNEPGNLFIVSEDAFGMPSVDWVGDRELELLYSPGLDVRVFTESEHDVRITVEERQKFGLCTALLNGGFWPQAAYCA